MIDRYDAPDGMVAVRNIDFTCYNCKLFEKNSKCYPCRGKERADCVSCFFVTRADFEKMLLQEIEQFYGKGKVKRIVFTEE